MKLQKLISFIFIGVFAHAQAYASACERDMLEIEVMTDNVARLASLLETCETILQDKDLDGETILFTAVKFNALDSAKILLAKGASARDENNLWQSPLFFAQSKEMAALMLKDAPSVNALDKLGYSAFHYMMELKSWELLEYMLERGARINVNDLSWASSYYHRDLLDFLATNISSETIKGNGAFFKTFHFYEQEYRDIASKLVAKGADLNKARLITSKRSLLDSYVNDYVKDNRNYKLHGSSAIEFLVQNGADVNAYSPRSGQSIFQNLLSRPDYRQNLTFLKIFLENGLELDRLHSGKNALMSLSFHQIRNDADAAYVKNMTQALIDEGADINAQNSDGRSALHWAIRWESPVMAKVLIENGHALNIRDNNGRSPMEYALERLRQVPSNVNKKPLAHIIKLIRAAN